MPFAKGHKGFRPKGSLNQKTVQWEAFSEYCLSGGLKKFQEEIEKLHGKDYVIAFTNLLEYHAPKLARVETKDTSEPKETTVRIIMVEKGER